MSRRTSDGVSTDRAAPSPEDDSLARDLVGYGSDPPTLLWPEDRRLAVSFVVNYEAGAERNYLDDGVNETVGGIAYTGVGQARDLALESNYEFGSRVGVWRLLELFGQYSTPLTIFACGLALARNEDVGRAFAAAGHEICGHGWRWEEAWTLSPDEERESILKTSAAIQKICGEAPVGWYSRYGPSVNTRRLLVEAGTFLYDSDAYNDEVPYTRTVNGKKHLILPYSNMYNDGRYAIQPIWPTPSDWLENITAGIDFLLKERWTGARMITIGLHPRWVGHPARTAALAQLLDFLRAKEESVWIARRKEIASWWLAQTS